MKRRCKGQKRKHCQCKKKWEEYPEVLEEKWKDNFWKVKPIDLHLNIDTDRDNVPDRFDCDPFNPNKQDAGPMPPTRPDVARPTPVQARALPPEMSATKKERVEGPVGIARAQTRVPEGVNLPISTKQPSVTTPMPQPRTTQTMLPITPTNMIQKPTLSPIQTSSVTIRPDAPALTREQQAMLNTYMNSINNRGARVAMVFPQWVKDYVSQYGNISPR